MYRQRILLLLLLPALSAPTPCCTAVSTSEPSNRQDAAKATKDKVQRQEEFGGCRMCGWQRTCEELCHSAQEQCTMPWHADGGQCVLPFPLLDQPESSHAPGRLITGNVTYRLHKDVLSDLLHRYNQVKVMKEHGHSIGAGWPSSQEQQWLRYSLSLTFPRIALWWRLAMGPAAPLSPTCCHQECFWEEMYRASPDMPSLQSMLEKSVAAWKLQLANPNHCKYAPYGVSTMGAGLMAAVQAVLAQARTPIASMEAWVHRALQMSSGEWLAALLWPALLTAYQAIQACAGQPLLVLYIACVALLRTMLDTYLVWRLFTCPHATQSSWEDRLGCDWGCALFCNVVMGMLCGLFTAWLSLLDASIHAPLLLSLPCMHMLLRVAARQLMPHFDPTHSLLDGPPDLVGLSRTQLDVWLRRHLAALISRAEAGAPRPASPAGTAAATAAAVAHGRFTPTVRSGRNSPAAVSTPTGARVDSTGNTTVGGGAGGAAAPATTAAGRLSTRLQRATAAAADDDLLDGLEHYLLPSPNAVPVTSLLADTLVQMHAQPVRPVMLRRFPGNYTLMRAEQSMPGSPGRPHRGVGGGGGPTAVPLPPSPDPARFTRLHPAFGGASGGAGMAGMGGAGAAGPGLQASGMAARGYDRASGGFMGGTVADEELASMLDLLQQQQQERWLAREVQQQQQARPATPVTAAAAPAAAAAAAVPAVAAAAPAAAPPQQPAGISARQAAAQAAMAAIHWPPPLDIPAWLDDLQNIPHAFRCPITLSLMREPTQASSGVTYEKAAIFQWLQLHRVDPVTHVPLKRHRLTPNLNLRHMIEDWAAQQVHMQVDPCSSLSSDA